MCNLKVLSLTVVASLTMSVMLASAQASNPGKVIPAAPSGTTLHGAKLAGEHLTFTTSSEPPIALGCTTATFDYVGATIPGTGATEFSFTPTYSGCSVSGMFATVTHNECTLRFYHLTTTTPGGLYGPTVELKCPAGKPGIEIHDYLFSNHTFQVCTLTITPQTFTKLTNLDFTHEGSGTTTSLILNGTIEGMAYNVSNCSNHPSGATTDGTYYVDMTVTGQTHAGSHTAIKLGA